MVARSTVLSISLYLAVSSVAANSLVPAKRNVGSQVVSADSAPSSLARRDQEFAVQGRKTSNKWNKRSQSGQPSDSSDPDTASDSDSDSDSATNNVAKNRKRALVTRSLAKKRSLPSSLVRRNQSPPGGSGSDTGNDSDSSIGSDSDSDSDSPTAQNPQRSLATRSLRMKRFAPSSLARRSSQSGAPDQSSSNTGNTSSEETSSDSPSGDESQSSNDDSQSSGEGSSSGGSDTSGGSGNSSDSSSDSPTGQNTTRALATRSLMMKRFAPSSLVPRSSQSGVPVQSTSNTGNTSGEESPSSSEENQSSGEESPSDDENPQAPPLSTRSLKKRSPSPFFGRGSDGQGIGDPNGKVHYHHHHHHQLHHDHRRQHGTPYASGLQKRAWGSQARNQRMHAAQGGFDGHDAKHFHHRHEHGRLAESGGPSKWQQRTRSMYPNLESLD
ncbi:hypothetical protein FRB97_000616 [Tulasnella sp. 331]|nr:hypothetical protein FRB97_000616 [Tulasnella sp. 331]